MTDVFVLLTAPGAGDQLQSIKRGIMEKADVVIVNKADGHQQDEAARAAADIRSAIHMTRNRQGHPVHVLTVSSLVKDDFGEVWETLSSQINAAKTNGSFERRRSDQNQQWFRDAIGYQLRNRLKNDSKLAQLHEQLRSRVETGAVDPVEAALEYVNAILSGAAD